MLDVVGQRYPIQTFSTLKPFLSVYQEGVVEDEEFEYPSPPPVFISYQWGFQNEVKLLKQHLNMAGYECWMDVGQMGGGDKLFAKIDNGIRGAKVVICCTTEKYAQSPNCNREVGNFVFSMNVI